MRLAVVAGILMVLAADACAYFEPFPCAQDAHCADGDVCSDGRCVRGGDEGGEGAGEGEGEGGEGEGVEGEEGEGEAGEGEGEGEGGCGEVTAQGECVGDVARSCVDGVIVAKACSEPFFDPDVTACAEINSSYGVDCAVAVGSSCQLGGGFALCQGDGPGCNVTAVNAVCVEGIDNCSAVTLRTCSGSVFTLGCGALVDDAASNGQPTLLDCAAFSGAVCAGGVGCRHGFGSACTPDLTTCGNGGAADAPCPASGTCPCPEGAGCLDGAANGTCHGGACCAGCWDGTSCLSGTDTGSCGVNGGGCGNCRDLVGGADGNCGNDPTCAGDQSFHYFTPVECNGGSCGFGVVASCCADGCDGSGCL